LADAIAAFKTAIKLKPDFPVAKTNLAAAYFEWGNALLAKGQTDEALEAFEHAVALKPDFIEALDKIGQCLQSLEQFDGAVAAFQTIIRLKPDMFEAFNNLGIALQALGKIEEAIAAFKKAVALKPDCVSAVSNLARALSEAGRPEDALAWRVRAVEIDPSSRVTHSDLGLQLLLLGQYERGWREFEYRCNVEIVEAKLRPMAPRWNGQDLSGKTILLVHEQGWGDLIQFSRYVPLLAQKTGGKILLECPAALRRLLDGLPSLDRLVLDGDPRPAFDYYCPVMSMGMLLGTTPQTIPADVPYLRASPDLVKIWRDRLGPRGKHPRVGIAWAGNPKHKNDHNRSVRLEQLAPLACEGNVEFHSLQTGPAASQALRPPAGMTLIDFTAHLTDFAETAALVENLDLVICVDTAAAHLAGAMAKPVWLLLPRDPDWRWMLGRSDTPWYPTMRLFRQTAPRDWVEVIHRVAKELAGIRPSASRPLQSGP
jgi:Flp pilus assembly protein TadD